MRGIPVFDVRLSIILPMLFFFSSCSPRRTLRPKFRDRDFFKEQEARFSDLPIPLNIQLLRESDRQIAVDSNSKNSGLLLRFKTSETGEKIQNFYKQEMEHWGWKLESSYEGEESFYYFKKPTRWCCVLIRLSKNNCVI